MFSINEKIFDNQPGQVHPEGKYSGKILSAKLEKSKANDRVIALQIKTPAGMAFERLNFDHAKCKAITLDTISKIIVGGCKNPPSKLNTVEDIVYFLKGLPVNITVKHKGQDEKGFTKTAVYFNKVAPAEQITVTTDGQAPKASGSVFSEPSY